MYKTCPPRHRAASGNHTQLLSPSSPVSTDRRRGHTSQGTPLRTAPCTLPCAWHIGSRNHYSHRTEAPRAALPSVTCQWPWGRRVLRVRPEPSHHVTRRQRAQGLREPSCQLGATVSFANFPTPSSLEGAQPSGCPPGWYGEADSGHRPLLPTLNAPPRPTAKAGKWEGSGPPRGA